MTKTPPSRIHIFRKGMNPTTKGTFIMNDDCARICIARFTECGNHIPVDYNHSMVASNATPDMAVAAGWITAMHWDGDTLYGDVEWTDMGYNHVQSNLYKYTSPTFYTDGRGRVTEIITVSLTNTPATYHQVSLSKDTYNMDDLFTQIAAAEAIEGLPQEVLDVLAACKAALGAKSEAEVVEAECVEDKKVEELNREIKALKAQLNSKKTQPVASVKLSAVDAEIARFKQICGKV